MCNVYERRSSWCRNSVEFISSETVKPQTIVSNEAISFDNRAILGRGIIHVNGTADFNVHMGGIYLVTFTGTVSALTGNVVSAGICINGNLIPSSVTTENVSAVGNQANISTQTTVNAVDAGCYSANPVLVITVVSAGGATEIFTNCNIVIQKVD